jgi:hypothetical protein
MATTYEAIATVTVGSGGAANIEFTSIPGTYTDLVLKWSGRAAASSSNTPVDNMRVTFNSSSSSGYAGKLLYAIPNSVFSVNSDYGTHYVNGGGSTASTFSNNEMYIPNYTSSNNKSYCADMVSETNATAGFLGLLAQTSSITAAITTIKFEVVGYNFAQHSTATLYGIKNS